MSDLRLLSDIPAGILEPDRFEHSVYADVLADLFRSSRPAISVGLFGKWGQGKSSVVNLLKQKFDREQKTEGMRKYKVVIFNAWKSRGDHVRRQMLMEVLRQIDSPQYKNMRKFTQTLLPFDMWQSDEQVEYSENRRWWQALVNERVPGWVICVAVVSVCLFVATVLLIRGLWVGEPSALRIARALTVLCAWLFCCIITIAGWLRATSNRLLAYTEPVSNSQKLKYPEQFQQVFEDEVIKYCRKNGNLVLVVDDLDRCDPKTVVEALAAIRQFTKVDESLDPNFYCQFLVPCDERQVIVALEADGYTSRHDHERYHDYQSEELLRKFFDITLRMHDFLPDDLGDYAEKLAGDIGLSGQEAREIVALTNATTPRLVKKLLNSLRLSHDRIERAQNQSTPLLPPSTELPHLVNTERLIVALQETLPAAYNIIADNPGLIETDEIQVNNNGQESGAAQQQIKKAKEMIRTTLPVSAVTAHQLIHGKLPHGWLTLPCAGKLIRSLKQGHLDDFRDGLASLSDDHKNVARNLIADDARRIKTTADLTRRITLFARFAHTEDDACYIASCVDSCMEVRDHLQPALESFSALPGLLSVFAKLQSLSRKRLYEAILSNFLKKPTESPAELTFLFSTSNHVEPGTRHALSSWIAHYIGDSSSQVNEEAVGYIFRYLPEDRKSCQGLSPSAAIVLSGSKKWQDDDSPERKQKESLWPKNQLIKTLVGDNQEEAAICIKMIFSNDSILSAPVDLAQAGVGVRPAWATIRDLVKIIDPSQTSALYDQFNRWLSAQNNNEGVKLILEALWPVLLHLEPGHLAQVGDVIGNCIKRLPSDKWFVDNLPNYSSCESCVDQCAALCKRVFNKITEELGKQNAPISNFADILKSVKLNKWPVACEVDALLTIKLQQVASQGLANLEEWLKWLVPISSGTPEKFTKPINDLIESHRFVDGLKAGIALLWSNGIDPNAATSIGNQCVQQPQLANSFAQQIEALVELEGGVRVVDVMVTGLQGKAPEWLHSSDQLVSVIAKGLKRCSKEMQTSFQSNIKVLLLQNNQECVKSGLKALAQVEDFTNDIKKEIERLAQNDKMPQAKCMAAELLSRMNSA